MATARVVEEACVIDPGVGCRVVIEADSLEGVTSLEAMVAAEGWARTKIGRCARTPANVTYPVDRHGREVVPAGPADAVASQNMLAALTGGPENGLRFRNDVEFFPAGGW